VAKGLLTMEKLPEYFHDAFVASPVPSGMSFRGFLRMIEKEVDNTFILQDEELKNQIEVQYYGRYQDRQLDR
jgi:hypothetical protein